jgi:hypothetical protein
VKKDDLIVVIVIEWILANGKYKIFEKQNKAKAVPGIASELTQVESGH